jgi:site-specific recombinase XerD
MARTSIQHSGQILNTALKQAIEDTGLKTPQKYVGSHPFRHSLATDMLREGASLDEIGDVLRHRSACRRRSRRVMMSTVCARSHRRGRR